MNVMDLALAIINESDSDDEFRPATRPRFIRERLDHFRDLDDIDFKRRFRLSKRSALDVLELIDHNLEHATFEKNQAVCPMNQFLLCLRFYATGCTQLSAADFSGVSESTAHRIIHRVTRSLASLYRNYIFMPRNQAEICNTHRGFYSIARFPRVIGAVDCTHIKIRSPGGDSAEYYRNRKGYMSLNCQVICNADLDILDLVARWPGSNHDQTIFDHSMQRRLIEENKYGNVYLLGDSAYACRKYLMPPLLNPQTAEENLFNESQIRTRNPVERIFGVWKRRFPVLALGINTHLGKALPIIVACAVLYNILKRYNDTQPPDDAVLQLPMPWDALIEYGQVHLHNNGVAATTDRNPYRRALINDYFRTLNVVYRN